MKRVMLSTYDEDKKLREWVSSLGIEILSPDARMDSWVDGLIIGGGSDPGIPEDKERDQMEIGLISKAVSERIPVLGICRGAEMLTLWAGGKLTAMTGNVLNNHMSQWHTVALSDLWPKREVSVWSHHHLKIENPGNLSPSAFSAEGNIEAISDFKKRILGVLWHPERSANDGTMSILPWLRWIEKRF